MSEFIKEDNLINNDAPFISKSYFYMDKQYFSKDTPATRYHYHDYYELCYVLSGELCFFVKDKAYTAKKGDFIFINTYQIHSASSTLNEGYSRILLAFKKVFIQPILSASQETDLFSCFNSDITVIKIALQKQNNMEKQLSTILEEYQSKPPSYELYLKSSLVQLLILLNRHYNKNEELTTANTKTYYKTVSDICSYIYNHIEEELTLQIIAKRFFISTSYFSRIFKKVTGFTFIEYVNNIRVNEAQRLLTDTNLSILNISQTVGYNSCTHFGRIFKNIVGVSPLSYRQNNLTGHE